MATRQCTAVYSAWPWGPFAWSTTLATLATRRVRRFVLYSLSQYNDRKP
jgi:hypothetical protein